ncbi:universal stress protein [Methanolobus sp. WCC5]|uniref:universal stress protein n=1 Tax=Methanolobus sp. WCC5 TaxID=3125785 RepID=UPI00388EC28A
MSVEIRTIAIATDGSENVKNAVKWGIELAKANGARVSALYVVPHTGVTLAKFIEAPKWVLDIHFMLYLTQGSLLQCAGRCGQKHWKTTCGMRVRRPLSMWLVSAKKQVWK